MTEIKYYWLNNTPEYEDIEKAYQIVVAEDVAVELKWFVPHSGYYTALISPEHTMKMSAREFWVNKIPHIYGM